MTFAARPTHLPDRHEFAFRRSVTEIRKMSEWDLSVTLRPSAASEAYVRARVHGDVECDGQRLEIQELTDEMAARLAERGGVETIAYDELGVMTIEFGNGSVLRAFPDPLHESWNLTTSAGFMVYCLAGGKYAVWTGDDR